MTYGSGPTVRKPIGLEGSDLFSGPAGSGVRGRRAAPEFGHVDGSSASLR